MLRSQITVITSNGAITPSGTAPSSDAKAAAEHAAKAVDGVRRVDNQASTPESSATMQRGRQGRTCRCGQLDHHPGTGG